MIYLRQSTASQSVLIGPFVDSTDGVTAETGLTIANTDIRLSKNGANIAAKNSGGGTHDEIGYYTITLDATDTDTVGRLQLMVAASGALPVYHEYQVLEENVYDMLMANGGDLGTTVDAILTDTAEIGTAGAGLTALATQASVNTIDGIVDSILVDTAEIGAAGAGLTALATQASVNTIDGIVDAILVDTGTTIPAILGTPTDFGSGTSTLAANLQDMADNGTATFDRSTDSLQAIRDRGDAAWTTGAGGTPPQLLVSTTIATLASQTSFTLTAGSADNDAYNGAVVVVTDSATSTQKAVGAVSDYVGSTKTITLAADPAIFTMAVGDTVEIIAALGTGPTAAAIRAEIDSNSTQLAAILADTAEIGTAGAGLTEAGGTGDHLTAVATAAALATVDTNVDAILVDTGTTLPATLATLATSSALATVDSNVDAILVDTGTTLPASISTIDTNVSAILTDTGTTIPAQISGLNNLSAAQVNAEVVDALNTDTYAEPAQGTPGASITLAAKIGYLYKAWRNRSTQTATTYSLYNDDATTVDHKATVSDDGTTADKGEISTGP